MPDAPTPIERGSGISPTVWIVAAVILAAAGILRLVQHFQDQKEVLAELTLRDRTFLVEVAHTPTLREKGLGGRDGLGENEGMYFPFEDAAKWTFWMKDMRFPIDILWLREGKVVDAHHDVPVPSGDGPLATYQPFEPADAVLELRAGTARAIGVELGDPFTLRVLE